MSSNNLWNGLSAIVLAAVLAGGFWIILERMDQMIGLQAVQTQAQALQARALRQIAAQGRSPARTEAFEKRGY